jgi:hypothetical protein
MKRDADAHSHRHGVYSLISSTGLANSSPITCSGELWKIWKDERGETWIEIGHGINQCSDKGTASKAAKKILSGLQKRRLTKMT